MTLPPDLEVISGADLSGPVRSEILGLCSRAFKCDYEPFLNGFKGATHVLARRNCVLVGHALWITRRLQSDARPPIRTAYVEAVVAEPALQRQGLAAAVMKKLARAVADFELGALATGVPEFYVRLGWELWRGPLFIRAGDALRPTPGEKVMILRLPATPALDLDASLSAEWREGEPW